MSRARNRRNRDINPALKIRDFYSFGLQVLNEINFARMHPDEFLEKLEELNSTIHNDNCLYVEGVPFLYTNLKGSLEDAIDFLSKQKPLPGLIYNKTITQACDYLLDELIIHDGLEDDESNKYSLENRLSKFGEPFGETYELIDYGMFDPEFIVINFILCDGQTQKYERNVIFNPKIKCLGIAASILPSDKICTVINFCEEFYDKEESIPLEVQKKYNRNVPKFNTKTVKNYTTQKEAGKPSSNTEEKDYLDKDFDDYNVERRSSGKMFNMKRDEYVQRKNSIKQKKEQEEKDKLNNQQRGGTINIQPNVSKAKKEPMDSKRKEDNNNNNDNNDEDEEDVFRDDREVIRRKRTLHQPKTMEVIEEEKDEDEEPFDREFKIETPQKKRYDFKTADKFGKGNTYLDNLNKNATKNPTVSNSTVETKYVGDKKVTTTTTTKTETGKDGQTKTVTTTITEEVGKDQPRYRNKVVKDIPFKSYGRRQYQKPNVEFDIEKEMRELENDFNAEFGHLNLKSPIMPVFESTDDMFEKEDDIEMPEGAVSVEVKQKTITDSKGKPVLVVHKTIEYENGEKKTIIEKKNLVKK